MVTACAFLLGGMLIQNHEIYEPMRVLARARLNLLRGEEGGLTRVGDLAGAHH